MNKKRKKQMEICAAAIALMKKVSEAYKGSRMPPNVEAIGLELLHNIGMAQMAWSVMAVRNVMNDLLRSLIKLETAVSPPLKKAEGADLQC